MRRVIATLWLTVAAVAAQDCTLEGVVTDSATGTPLAGARVSAPSATSVADQFTDSSGRFCFTGLDTLPRGVRVNLAGYRNWEQRGQVKPDGTLRLLVKLTPSSEIEGQVLDEDGHPMPGVLMYEGTSHLATTDDEGRYRIHDLALGGHQIYCRLLLEARKKLLQKNGKTGEVLGYADTYFFPGVTDPSLATKTILGGGHMAGFDFRLRRGPLVEFSGKLVDRVSGEPLTKSAVEVSPGGLLTNETWKKRNVEQDGSFRFEFITPGHYTMLVYRDGAVDAGRLPFRVPVEIGAGGLKDAELRIPQYVNLPVNITLPHPERTEGRVMISLEAYRDGSRIVSSMRPPCWVEQACMVQDVPPGEWMFDVQATSLREMGDSSRFLYIASVRLGQQEASRKPVMVAEGGNPPLEIELTGDVGSLEARLTVEDEDPVPGMLVARRMDGTGPLRQARNFRLDGLLPGDYEVAALPRDDATTMRIDSLVRCGDRAAKVTVTAGQTSMVSLRPCVADRR